jgi:hypothetical protein
MKTKTLCLLGNLEEAGFATDMLLDIDTSNQHRTGSGF